ncbi:MAG: acyltransferase [Lachnospiraceae bacterium]|nr:acyltransferase [Lachnospiraceae bacterium]
MKTILTDRQTDRQTDRHDYIIDCWRILAILMVLSVHVNGYLNAVPNLIHRLLSIGAYGVALYFLISGFLSYPSVESSKYMKEYAFKKAIRILPMYYLSLIATFILDALFLGDIELSWKWIYHVFFVNMFVPSAEWEWWNSVNFFWTMPCFVAWYILSPVFFKFIKSSRGALIASVVSAAVVPFIKKWMYTFASEKFVNWNFLCLLYVFFFGVLAWLVIKEKCYVRGFLYGCIIGMIGLLCGNRSGFFVFGLVFYFGILITSWLGLKINNGKAQTIIKAISGVTYSVYLSHYFVLKALNGVFAIFPWPIAYICFIAVAFAFGYVLYRFVETPVADFLKKKARNNPRYSR